MAKPTPETELAAGLASLGMDPAEAAQYATDSTARILAAAQGRVVTDSDPVFAEGRECWENLGSDARNPHIPGTLDWTAWQHGHDAAREAELGA